MIYQQFYDFVVFRMGENMLGGNLQQQLYKVKLLMKVKIKTVLKTPYSNFQCFEDQQIIFRSGNTLCIKEIGKNQSEFICLSKNMDRLFAFKPTTNRKGVFTAQRSGNIVEIAQYSLKGERKSMNISDESPFFLQVQKIELLVDEYDNNLVYGAAKSKDNACIFLLDIAKIKIIGIGFLGNFQDIKVDGRQNMSLSICGHNGNANYVKSLRYGIGQWEIQEILYKKIQNGIVIMHELLFGNRVLMATKSTIYLFEETDLLHTVDFSQEGLQIQQILKVARGILVRLSNHTIRILIQDSDETTLLTKGQIMLELQPQDKVKKMMLSTNNEEIVLRTHKNFLYLWKCEHLGLEAGHSELIFNKVESSCVSQKQGNISLSTGKGYCMLSGPRVVTLWSIQRNQFVLSSEFVHSFQPQKKTILACGINPDGMSFMLAFEDRIKIYKILLTKFKLCSQFPIKRCQNIVYSHGGQFAACRYGKGINACISIVNILRLVTLGTLKVQSQPTQIIWNELDDELIVATQNNAIQYFRVSDNHRTHSMHFDSHISHVRIDYKLRKILVSSQNKIYVVDNGKIIEIIQSHLPHFHYIFPLYGIYFAASKTGVLYWSNSIKFQSHQEFSLFTKVPFQLVCRNGYLVAFSSFDDIKVLSCIRPNHIPLRSSGDEVVMIEKQEVNALLDKVKTLQSNFDMLTSATQIKLDEERTNYQHSIQTFKQQYMKEINFINNKYSDMAISKLKQERDTECIFESLETGQNTSVNELEKMYQRKLTFQREKYLTLEQANLEQKIKYQKIIIDLETKYHKDIKSVRENYGQRIKAEVNQFQKVKENNLQEKSRMEVKLLNMEDQNQLTLINVQSTKDQIIQTLNQNEKSLKAQLKNVLLRNRILQDNLADLKSQNQIKISELNRANQKLFQNQNRIKLLETEIAKKNTMIEDKNQIITEQGVQIGGLQKAKYVLNFRTTQIRKELQPKQALADKLKSELFKVDDQFKQEKKKTFQLAQDIDKLKKINELVKKQNGQIKFLLKNKERIHDELCSQIFMIINTIDPKDWNASFIKIYQSYIKEDKHRNRRAKKKDDNVQQLNRHLVHVEQSLIQVSTGNDKILRGKQKDIVRKMKQNSELVFQLNVMRKRQKEFIRQKNEMTAAMQKMKKDIDQTHRNSTRAQTANTGLTRRGIVSRDALSKQKSALLDINDFDSLREKDLKLRNKQRSRIASAHKTMMFRDNVKREQSGKLFDLAKQLQSAKHKIKRQDQMLEQLNQRIFVFPESERQEPQN